MLPSLWYDPRSLYLYFLYVYKKIPGTVQTDPSPYICLVVSLHPYCRNVSVSFHTNWEGTQRPTSKCLHPVNSSQASSNTPLSPLSHTLVSTVTHTIKGPLPLFSQCCAPSPHRRLLRSYSRPERVECLHTLTLSSIGVFRPSSVVTLRVWGWLGR